MTGHDTEPTVSDRAIGSLRSLCGNTYGYTCLPNGGRAPRAYLEELGNQLILGFDASLFPVPRVAAHDYQRLLVTIGVRREDDGIPAFTNEEAYQMLRTCYDVGALDSVWTLQILDKGIQDLESSSDSFAPVISMLMTEFMEEMGLRDFASSAAES